MGKFSLQKIRICYFAAIALVAQLVEHLICNQGVAGSNPAGGTSFSKPLHYMNRD